MTVEAIRLKEIYAEKLERNSYFKYYLNCPYCEEENVFNDDNMGYFICGKCSRTFYVK